MKQALLIPLLAVSFETIHANGYLRSLQEELSLPSDLSLSIDGIMNGGSPGSSKAGKSTEAPSISWAPTKAGKSTEAPSISWAPTKAGKSASMSIGSSKAGKGTSMSIRGAKAFKRAKTGKGSVAPSTSSAPTTSWAPTGITNTKAGKSAAGSSSESEAVSFDMFDGMSLPGDSMSF